MFGYVWPMIGGIGGFVQKEMIPKPLICDVATTPGVDPQARSCGAAAGGGGWVAPSHLR